MPVRARRKRVTFRNSEHEYEPIAPPSSSPKPATAPVVRITDTDVVPVADSDDSIDDRARLPPELTRAGDVVLPLDGKIEDTAMEARELVETGDTSEELETPQQLQERLEERFLNAATPATDSRTDGEVNTSQVSVYLFIIMQIIDLLFSFLLFPNGNCRIELNYLIYV